MIHALTKEDTRPISSWSYDVLLLKNRQDTLLTDTEKLRKALDSFLLDLSFVLCDCRVKHGRVGHQDLCEYTRFKEDFVNKHFGAVLDSAHIDTNNSKDSDSHTKPTAQLEEVNKE